MDRRKKRTSTRQYMMYINMMEQDPIFASGKLPRDVDVNYLLNKWKELAEQLNTCDNGPTLTAEEWRKRLNDWKNTTRCKYRRSQSGEKDINMTSLEMKALNLFGRVPNATTEHLSIQLKAEKEECEEDLEQHHPTSESFHKELEAAVNEAIGGDDEEDDAHGNEHDESDELITGNLPATAQVISTATANAHNSGGTTTYRTIVVEDAAFTDEEPHEEQVEFIAHRRSTVATNTQTASVQTVPSVTKLINGEIPLKRLRTQTSDQIIYEVKKAPAPQQHAQRAYTTTQYTNATPTVITHHYTQPAPQVESIKQDLSVGGIFSSQDAREIARQLKRLADIKNEKLKFDIARFKFNNPGFQYSFSSL